MGWTLCRRLRLHTLPQTTHDCFLFYAGSSPHDRQLSGRARSIYPGAIVIQLDSFVRGPGLRGSRSNRTCFALSCYRGFVLRHDELVSTSGLSASRQGICPSCVTQVKGTVSIEVSKSSSFPSNWWRVSFFFLLFFFLKRDLWSQSQDDRFWHGRVEPRWRKKSVVKKWDQE